MLDWDMLAPVWTHFQNTGFDEKNLDLFVERMQGPCVLVGAGQGLVAPALAEQAPPLLCVDTSFTMAIRGWAERQIRVIVGDGLALPAADGWARSAVVNTGVLAANQPEFCMRILRELHRAMAPGGLAIINGFVAVGPWARMGRDLGIIEGQIQHNDRMLELWQAGREPERMFERIVTWTGCDPREGLARLQKHVQEVGRLVRFFEAVAKDLEKLGHDPVPYLQKAYAVEFPIFTVENLLQLVQEAGFEPQDAGKPEDTGSILVLLCRRTLSPL